jgi:ribosomal protein L19
MTLETESLEGVYIHVKASVNRTIKVKKIIGKYAIIETDFPFDSVMVKDIIFNNYNKVRDLPKDEECYKH